MSQQPAHFNLCVIQPAGYVHSLGLLDAALYFKHQFTRLGARVEVSKNRLIRQAVNLIFGAHLGFDLTLTGEYNCVIVNLEQLGEGGAQLALAYMELLKQAPVIDYDVANTICRKARPRDVPIVRFGHAPYLAGYPCGAEDLARRPIDLLFFGSVNARRQDWIQRIEATGRRVSVLNAPIYGPERDSIITQAKAVLNVHHYDSARFEQVRAFQVLSLGTPLVSERGLNSPAPDAFETCSLWFDETGLESFFREEFLSPLFFEVGARALEVFRDDDPLEDYARALDFALTIPQARSVGMTSRARMVRRMNLDLRAGEGYRQGWLNVAPTDHPRPDLILNLTHPQQWPLEADSRCAGRVLLAAGEMEEIRLAPVGATDDGLSVLMEHGLRLLRLGGMLEVVVRPASAVGVSLVAQAQALCHPYTEGFAASGWFNERFELRAITPINANGLSCAPEAAEAVSVQLVKIETGLAERTKARAMRSDFGVGYAMLDAEALDQVTAPSRQGRQEARDGVTCSIVVPVFNKVDFTRQCVEQVARSAPSGLYELIVIDNASSDGTAEYLAGLGERVKVISNGENLGFVGACNQGAAAARGRYIVFLNNDTVPLSGWLEALVHMMDGDQSIGAAGARLVYPDGKLQEAGGLIFSDGSGWNFGRFQNPADPAYNRPCEVDYCSGAALMVRRELFERLGGLDIRYSPAYYEDTDLCFGIRSLGYKVMYCPESTVVHFEGITAGTDTASGFKRYQPINHRKFVEKWAQALVLQDPPPRISGRQPTTADRHRLERPAMHTREPSVHASYRPHVLVVDPFLPMYDRASGSLRLFRIVQMFRAMDCEVTFIARMGNGQQIYQRELEALGVKVYANDPEKLARLGYGSSAEPVDLRRILTERPCQIAWLSFYDIAEQYLQEIREYSPATAIVTDTVDVHFLRETRQAQLVGDVAALAKAAQTRARELSIYGQADLVVTVTDADAQTLVDAGLKTPTLTVPNIHVSEEQVPGWNGREGLVFVGNFSHTPNIDAVLWMVREILPRVHARLPGVRLDIVGNNPPADVRSLASAQVQVHGWVPDTKPHLDAARISIAPVRVGAGMKGKVGEALAHGLPVVTTSVGAEGMDLVDGRDVLIADTADTFANSIIRLYQDRAMWERMACTGRESVERRYGISAVARILHGLMQVVTEHCVGAQEVQVGEPQESADELA